MVEMTIDVKMVETLSADSRGRVTIGAEYADKDVAIAVIDTEDGEVQKE